MRKINIIKPKIKLFKAKKKVAAYARVSRDSERLMHSASAQVSYYSDLIQKNPEWEYAGVYADYGITGRKIEVRDEFKRMLQDCEDGKIDIILTKSISRFARNTVDLLEAVRHLKELGVEVRFEKEHINTLSSDGELMLSILASFAQEESRSISENLKWGVRKRFKSGTCGVRNKHLLGYQYDEKQKKYVIIPEEAAVVRWIFQQYLDDATLSGIAKQLNSAGMRSVYGTKFSSTTINNIIRNEVYAGIIRRQKTYVKDSVIGRKVMNNGELPQYIIEDAHEAILDKETYARVLEEHKRRDGLARVFYPFSAKIVCGCCGQKYTRLKNHKKGSIYAFWTCHSKHNKPSKCKSRNYMEDELERITASVLGMDKFDADIFSKEVRELIVQPNGDIEFNLVNGEVKVWKDVGTTSKRYKRTVTDCFKGRIVCARCGRTYYRVVSKQRWSKWLCPTRACACYGHNCDNDALRDYSLRQISALMMGIDEFTEEAFLERIEQIKVVSRQHLVFKFKDGSEKEWREV